MRWRPPSDLPATLRDDAVPQRPKSESQVIAVSHLMKAMPSTPTAVLAWLERRFPQELGGVSSS
jgi:hypothetical protein